MVTGIVKTGISGNTGGAIRLPKTVQTTCYDNSGGAISCTHTGQDGDLRRGVEWPNPRFVANTDTTITDKLTGLVRAPNANLLFTRDSQWEKRSAAFEGAVTWQHALDYVVKLNSEHYLGHDDWRMPNFIEIESLVNRAQSSTAKWLDSQGFTNVQSADYFWSSTTNLNDTSKAWAVDMSYDTVHYFDKANSHFIWPVRGGQ